MRKAIFAVIEYQSFSDLSMTHPTKGIILRTVKYGETSIIATAFTERFGIQSYLIKGVRKKGKHGGNSMPYFQHGAILDMEVYHNELKNLQFVKEYSWSYLYESVLFHVVKNAVAMYIIELILHTVRQPEANRSLYDLVEETLKFLDNNDLTFAANLPLYFTLHLGSELGFQLQGNYSPQTPVLDLHDGHFISSTPSHPYYLSGYHAECSSFINNIQNMEGLSQLRLNKYMRRELLTAYQQYISMHVSDFGSLKTLEVLQQALD